MRTLILLTALALSGAAHAGADTSPMANKIRAELPSYAKIPASQLNSKKFQTFIKSGNAAKNYTSYELLRAHGPTYEVGMVAKRVYPGRIFVVRSVGNGPEWFKNKPAKKLSIAP